MHFILISTKTISEGLFQATKPTIYLYGLKGMQDPLYLKKKVFS